MSIEGARRRKKHRTTSSDLKAERSADLVDQPFTATRPNQLWVTDFTYVPTWSGLVTTLWSLMRSAQDRWLAGSNVDDDGTRARHIGEMAIWTRDGNVDGVIAHSDAGSRYTSIRYTERLAEAGAAPSIGSIGETYDYASAESTIGSTKRS